MAEWEPYEVDLDRITVTRFTTSQRVQHEVLVASFTILIITGLPVLFPEISSRLLGGAFSFRTFLHHFAGVVLIGLSVFHVYWALFTAEGRREVQHMIPRFKDLTDLVHFVKHQTGHTDEPAPFDKYDPFEKFEYLAVVWGSGIMILTGLTLWFFEFTLQFFPKWVYDLVLMIHGYEAVLAFLAVILGHLYNVHLKPGVFPMSRVWLDGKISLRKLKEHHPLEYERWLAEQRLKPQGSMRSTRAAANADSPSSGATEVKPSAG
jgi:cytochrome b subunit of formate dehydrogenase